MISTRSRFSRPSFAGWSLLALLAAPGIASWSHGEATAEGDEARRPVRTRAQTLELIREAGESRPDWWADTPLRFPETLDLSWPKAEGPWNPRKNVGQYMWSVINENPSRWREGTKFMHYVHAVSKERPRPRALAVGQLAHCYHDLLGDWARAAYWLRKIERHNLNHVINLADCYWKLGCKEMAVEQLERIRIDYTRYGSAIKLWSDMGEIEKALELARRSLGPGRPDAALMGAGDACRRHDRHQKAVEYYEKVLALPSPAKRDDLLERNKARARACIEGIRIFKSLDIEEVADGTYRGSSLAYNGDLTVAASVEDGRITSIRIEKHSDKQYYSALTDMPAQIIEKQDLKDLDATTGATITAEAIVWATGRALSSAAGK